MSAIGDEIKFIDTTLRDGNQSLWGATVLTAPMILSIASVMDRAGFKAVDYTTGTHMAVSVRYHKENPFERLRLVHKAMPNTPLIFGGTGIRFMGWKRAPESVVHLGLQTVIANGIKRVWTIYNKGKLDTVLRTARVVKEAGAENAIALSYSISPVHTDEFYAQQARDIAKSPDIDAVYIKDQGGLLTVDRVRTLVPAIQQAINGLPLEIHAHCNTGLAPLCYLEAIRLGVRIIHTAISPLANGTSQPSTENMVKNVRGLGYSANLDEEALKSMATHFKDIAERERKPLGAPVEYDVYYYEHQVPGGMMTTLKRQLAEMGKENLLDKVLEEIIQVRKELGYPVMVTPFSQFVGAQATMNVISSERYKIVPDEVIEYVKGYFGEPSASIDPNVLDKITSSPKAKDILGQEPPEPTIEELRRKIGPGLSDEEFLLRLTLPEKEVEEMFAAGSIKA